MVVELYNVQCTDLGKRRLALEWSLCDLKSFEIASQTREHFVRHVGRRDGGKRGGREGGRNGGREGGREGGNGGKEGGREGGKGGRREVRESILPQVCIMYIHCTRVRISHIYLSIKAKSRANVRSNT